jgi:hypothetical protein
MRDIDYRDGERLMNPVQEGEPTTRQPMRSAVLVAVVAVAAVLGIAHGVLIAAEAAQRTATWIVTVPVRPTLAFPADLPITGLVLTETPDMTRMPTAFDGGLVMFLERPDPLTAVLAGELGHVSAEWFAPRFEPQWWPLGFAAFMIVLAVSVRQGSRMAAETEGLV